MRIQNDSRGWTDKTAKISVKSCAEFEKQMCRKFKTTRTCQRLSSASANYVKNARERRDCGLKLHCITVIRHPRGPCSRRKTCAQLSTPQLITDKLKYLCGCGWLPQDGRLLAELHLAESTNGQRKAIKMGKV